MTRHWLMDQWRDAFVTEMRLRGVPGRQIGEALAEADAVAHHAPGAVTVGQVIPAALAPLLMAVIVIAIQQPGHGSRRALLAVSFPVCATAAAIPQFLWPRPVVQVPGPALLATGLLLLSLALGPATARRLPADRVIDPRTGSEPYHIPAWIPAVIRCALPAVLLAAVLLILLTPARPG